VHHRFRAELWRYPGETAWYFVTLPLDVADDVEAASGPGRRGFGSVRVAVTVGATRWRTSVFPSKEAESYLLPVKKQVRVAEDLHDGTPVDVTLELVDDPEAP
jgi:hypothetical protein